MREAKGYIESEFILTTQRVIFESGGFRRHTLDMYLKRINSLEIDKSLLGQLLGYGNIRVKGGSDKPLKITIANPNHIRQQIQDQIAKQ